MKFNKIISICLFAFLAIMSSCKKDDDHKQDHDHGTPKGRFLLEFDHVWGMNMQPFSLNTLLVHPGTGDTMTFTTLRYYISNIKLKKTDGTWYVEPESYYIVDASSESGRTLEIKNIPAGEYIELRYTVGVDSARNVSGAQTGALSPSHGMFWSWNTGYIMIKAEGTSPQSPNGSFSFHLGGFRPENNIVVERSTDFNGQVLRISPNGTPKIHMFANPARFRHSLGSLSNGASTVHMPGSNAQTMANDFTSWIRFDHMHN